MSATERVQQDYSNFIYKRTYSRWLDEHQRREEWPETVQRYKEFLQPHVPHQMRMDFEEAIQDVQDLKVMGSMRALWTAGPALSVDNIAGYNCAYTPIQDIKDFAEVLYILMNGAGVGISVERQYLSQLPEVPPHVRDGETEIYFGDSKRGWAEGFHRYLRCIFNYGIIPKYDLSQIRPKGSRLKTFGGRASGPEPLRSLLEYTRTLVLEAKGRQWNSEQVADLVCKIADIVIVGGVRRSAILILSNPSDRRMAEFKSGRFWMTNPHRALANVSACYTEQPDMLNFLKDWLSLVQSGTGERGTVNRESLKTCLPPERNSNHEFGVNPCGEIILRPKQFCNLSEVVLRPGLENQEIQRRIKSAVVLGCLQSLFTSFNFLSEEWTKNTVEERLLGVSLTGIQDTDILARPELENFREYAEQAAEDVAYLLGITAPKAITCVKPSGTVSQLVNASSGLHPRYSDFYIRRVRVSYTDPLARFLMDQGVPHSPEVGETWEDVRTVVFEFPIASPEMSRIKDSLTAIQQLENWKKLKEEWCDHNPSVTVYVQDHEWLEVGDWIYKNWHLIGGITLLPYDGGNYPLAPYEEIDKKAYKRWLEYFPLINWEEFPLYETKDNTIGAGELACAGGGCDV